MKIIRKRIADMERATYNPRVELQPGDAEYETLKRSLEQFGMVEPVVWNERTNRVVGGHQRLTVEAALGHEEVDVSVVDLDEIKEKELNIALNKIGGRWDTEKLGTVFDSLGDRALETGFTQPEIDEVQAKLEQLIDQGMIDQELAQIEKTFNLSLRFDQHDRDDLEAYIKTHGKDSLVAVILKTVFEEGNNNGV
jgi:ParB-like chromosome segregation protein Spo0J